MRALVFVLALAACGDNEPRQSPADAGPADAAPIDGTLAHCLDQPGELARPPTAGQLSCDLLPPGFGPP
ncbi:MAG: hypothetical protein WKG01_24440 [Kofleriaceae bacterium]